MRFLFKHSLSIEHYFLATVMLDKHGFIGGRFNNGPLFSQVVITIIVNDRELSNRVM